MRRRSEGNARTRELRCFLHPHPFSSRSRRGLRRTASPFRSRRRRLPSSSLASRSTRWFFVSPVVVPVAPTSRLGRSLFALVSLSLSLSVAPTRHSPRGCRASRVSRPSSLAPRASSRRWHRCKHTVSALGRLTDLSTAVRTNRRRRESLSCDALVTGCRSWALRRVAPSVLATRAATHYRAYTFFPPRLTERERERKSHRDRARGCRVLLRRLFSVLSGVYSVRLDRKYKVRETGAWNRNVAAYSSCHRDLPAVTSTICQPKYKGQPRATVHRR